MLEDTPARVTVELKTDDLAAWHRFQLWDRTRLLRRLVTNCTLVVVLLCILSLLAGNGPSAFLIFAPLGLGIGLVFFLFELLQLGVSISGQAKQRARSDPQVLEPRSYTPLLDGLEMVHNEKRVVIPWSYFKALHALDRHLFLEIPGDYALIIPRAAFPSPATSQQFFARCEAYASASGLVFEPLPGAPPAGTAASDVKRGGAGDSPRREPDFDDE